MAHSFYLKTTQPRRLSAWLAIKLVAVLFYPALRYGCAVDVGLISANAVFVLLALPRLIHEDDLQDDECDYSNDQPPWQR